MVVCKRCLMAIEAHEGRQAKKEIEYDDDRINDNDEIFCEWCEEFYCSSDCVEIDIDSTEGKKIILVFFSVYSTKIYILKRV